MNDIIKNPSWSIIDENFHILNKPLNEYNIISNGEWYIKDTKVEILVDFQDGMFLMNGWIIKDYKVREDEEMCGIDEFVFIDKETNEKYTFDPEPFGIIKDNK